MTYVITEGCIDLRDQSVVLHPPHRTLQFDRHIVPRRYLIVVQAVPIGADITIRSLRHEQRRRPVEVPHDPIAARQVQASFLKTYTLAWSTEAMLSDALRARLTQLGVTAVPVRVSEALMRAREACFLNANLARGLPKECAAPYAQFSWTGLGGFHDTDIASGKGGV